MRIPEVLVPFMGGITFLPFVRELKSGLRGDKKPVLAPKIPPASIPVVPPSTAAPSQPPQHSASSAGSADSEATTLADKITAQGNVVRDLKAAKADKASITEAVEQLKVLKMTYKEIVGADFGADANAVPAKVEKSEKKEKKTEVTAAGNNETVPPKDIPQTTPAPQPRATNRESNGASRGMWKVDGEQLDLAALNSKLAVFSYVDGYSPTAQDRLAFNAVGKARVLPEELGSHAQRWFRHVSSFAPHEREMWK